jgi:hypothetical protein
MDERHVEHPERVRVALDALGAGIPDEAVAVREVPRVSHRHHRIVEQREVALAADDEAGAVDEERRVDEKRGQRQREDRAIGAGQSAPIMARSSADVESRGVRGPAGSPAVL